MKPAFSYLLSVVGPTAIGKTKLGIALAAHYNTEIVSADSRQFYKEMTLGTAVPSKEELALVPHHFIRHKSIVEPYSVGDFEWDTLQLLNTLFKKKTTVVMVGGSGLYVDAVTKGLDEFPKIDPNIRKQLNNLYNQKGILPLQYRLQQLDPGYYGEVDLKNPHRLIRALEVCLGTGKPYSSFLGKKKQQRPFKTITIGITAERKTIYDRINKRVDLMMSNGLLDEAKTLYKHRTLNALQTVGYKELFEYFDGTLTLTEAVEEIKKNTRRFAKRQLTWYRKQTDIVQVDFEEPIAIVISKIDSIRFNETF